MLLFTTLIVGALIVFFDWQSNSSPTTDIAFVDGQQYRPASIVNGLVISQKIREGDLVVSGQPLFILDSKVHEKTSLRFEVERMTLISEMKNIQVTLPNQKSRSSNVENAIKNTHQMLEYTKSRLSQFKLLGSNVSQTVVDDTTFELNAQQQQLNELNDTLFDLNKSIALTLNRQNDIQEEIRLLDKQIDLHAQIKNDYTIYSPVDGIVNNILVKQGEVASSGQALIDIIDNDHLYITAYFVESYLGNIAVGDEVKIQFDAYPEPIAGEVLLVESVAGAKVSGITPNYSSGSYTRLTQKIPVRISFKTDPNIHIALGMSAKVTIK